MLPSVRGSASTSGTQGQPTQAPLRHRRNGSSAVTSPPGLDFHCGVPSGRASRSIGNRLATTTKPASVVEVLVPSITDWPPSSARPPSLGGRCAPRLLVIFLGGPPTMTFVPAGVAQLAERPPCKR